MSLSPGASVDLRCAGKARKKLQPQARHCKVRSDMMWSGKASVEHDVAWHDTSMAFFCEKPSTKQAAWEQRFACCGMSGLDMTVQPSHHFDMGMVRTTWGVCDTSGPVGVYRRHRWSTQMTSNILCVMLGWIMFGVQKRSLGVLRDWRTQGDLKLRSRSGKTRTVSQGELTWCSALDGSERACAIGTKPGAVIIQCASTKDGTILSPLLVSNWYVTYTLKLLWVRGVIGRSTLLWDGAAIDLEHSNSSLRPLRSVLAQL